MTVSDDRLGLEERILASTEVIQRLWKSYLMGSIEHKSMTPAQFFALHELSRHRSLTSGKLCELLHVTPGAVTQIVDGLVHEEYVARTPHPTDRRVQELRMTERGKHELQRINQERKAIFVTIFSALSDHELQDLEKMQHKLQQRLEKLHTEKIQEGK